MSTDIVLARLRLGRRSARLGDNGGVKHSELGYAMEQAFGAGYAESVRHDQVIGALGGRTVHDALADGVAPKTVWHALCDAFDLNDDVRWSYRDEPPKR